MSWVCEAWYNTPLGVTFTEDRGATREEAIAKARAREVFGLVELNWLSSYEERDEGAEEGGHEPASAGEDVLGPEPVAAGEDPELAADGRPVLRPAPHGHASAGKLLPQGVVHELVLLLGESDKVKVVKLGKHRLLVNGPVDVLRLEPPFEVTRLARVLADGEEVRGEVGRD